MSSGRTNFIFVVVVAFPSSSFVSFESRSFYVAQSDLNLMILLPLLPSTDTAYHIRLTPHPSIHTHFPSVSGIESRTFPIVSRSSTTGLHPQFQALPHREKVLYYRATLSVPGVTVLPQSRPCVVSTARAKQAPCQTPGIVTKWMEQLSHPRTQSGSEAPFLCCLSHRYVYSTANPMKSCLM